MIETLQFNLPVIYRSFGSSTLYGTESGIGDVSLIGNYLAYVKLQEHLAVQRAVSST